jgi:hypothetical protein
MKVELQGYYMTFVEARGCEFLLTDNYPTMEIFPIDPLNGVRMHLHLFFPLSPTKLLILNHIMFRDDRKIKEALFERMINTSKIKGDLLSPPRAKYQNHMSYSAEDIYSYSLKKIYPKDIEYINQLFLNECETGFICRTYEKVESSISSYNRLDPSKKKNDFYQVPEEAKLLK